jgi:hypothetical protein
MPRIDNLFNKLNGAQYFSWIDLKSGYYQIHIMDGNVEKTTMMICYGSYEFLVMSFKLCNAPSTFTTFMNSIFHDNLDKFLIIYIDDIFKNSKFTKKHAEHIE